MKKICLIFLLAISASISKSQTADESQAMAMLKTFYTAYMTEFSKLNPHVEQNLIKLRKTYLTVKCEKKYEKMSEESDGDVIIKGQDSDEKWAKTLSVKRDLKKPNLYSVSYYNDQYGADRKLHKHTTTINLIVIKENGHFKIDDILL